jgi:hypothetical protein
MIVLLNLNVKPKNKANGCFRKHPAIQHESCCLQWLDVRWQYRGTEPTIQLHDW